MIGRPWLLLAALAVLGPAALPSAASAQSLPARVRVALETAGHGDFAERLSDRMGLRSTVDEGDVEDLLERWDDATGGPSGAWESLTVARLWLKAGNPERARDALERAEDGVPAGLVELERARIGFLAGDTDEAAAAYWRACEADVEEGLLEAWRDVEVLATPEELAAWDRFRRLPAGQRDACGFLRRFWNERAARSGVSTEERIALHYDRLRFAMDHYVRRGRAQDAAASGKLNARLGREGAPRFDDRGLLYMRLGPPDETARTIGGDCYEPNVSWYYRFPGGDDRLYHLSPLGGNDNWWLLSNLGEIFRCSITGSGNVAWDRNPMVAVAPILDRIPAPIMYDIYITRAQLDPRYAQMAYRFDDARGVEILQDERDLTWAAGRYAIAEVPERPDVRGDIGLVQEWIAFRLPLPDRTRMWMLLGVSGEDLAEIEAPPDRTLDVTVTALGEDGTQEHATGRLEIPESGSDVVLRLPLELEPGEYEARVVLRAGPPRVPGDEDRPPPSGSYLTTTLSVPEFSDALPRLSDIAVSPDSGGSWAQTDALALSPSPVHVTNDAGRLWIYFEAYNLTPGGRYTAEVLLEPEDDDARPFDLEFTGLASGAGRIVTPAGLRLDVADAPPGRYRLVLTVRDQATGRVTLPVRTEILVGGPETAVAENPRG